MRRRTLWHFGLALAVGLAVAVLATLTTRPSFAPSLGWDALAIAFMALKWRDVRSLDAEQTRAFAKYEDASRVLDELLVLIAATVSLVTVALVLSYSAEVQPAERVVRTVLGIVSVVLAWAVVHTVYTLRYARMYYTEPVGGIDFNSDVPPRYVDFAYLAFGIGMAFQVADTNLTSSALRSVVLRHALLSFVFATVILAVTINLVAGLNS